MPKWTDLLEIRLSEMSEGPWLVHRSLKDVVQLVLSNGGILIETKSYGRMVADARGIALLRNAASEILNLIKASAIDKGHSDTCNRLQTSPAREIPLPCDCGLHARMDALDALKRQLGKEAARGLLDHP